METHFSKDQLKNIDNKSSEKIFRNVSIFLIHYDL